MRIVTKTKQKQTERDPCIGRPIASSGIKKRRRQKSSCVCVLCVYIYTVYLYNYIHSHSTVCRYTVCFKLIDLSLCTLVSSAPGLGFWSAATRQHTILWTWLKKKCCPRPRHVKLCHAQAANASLFVSGLPGEHLRNFVQSGPQ